MCRPTISVIFLLIVQTIQNCHSHFLKLEQICSKNVTFFLLYFLNRNKTHETSLIHIFYCQHIWYNFIASINKVPHRVVNFQSSWRNLCVSGNIATDTDSNYAESHRKISVKKSGHIRTYSRHPVHIGPIPDQILRFDRIQRWRALIKARARSSPSMLFHKRRAASRAFSGA